MAGFFRNLFGSSDKEVLVERRAHPRIPRRSTGFQQFTRATLKPEGQNVLDLGPTSPANIQFITGYAHKAYNEDLLTAAQDPSFVIPGEEPGTKVFDAKRFLAENLTYERGTFDAVMLWDLCDYLPEALVKPVVDRIFSITKEKGLLLGFFHTKDAGPDAPYYRYHIANLETLELQVGPKFQLQRVFQNRHIENLFHDYSSLKFFLGKDNIREVLIVR
ncbi:MAG TPA: SAM-dependent methyltransferase [candidate division Zixibacteria bacterium]|nr:SAM-dependent methyltransferase [candidate division Zixibacteria bacterium]